MAATATFQTQCKQQQASEGCIFHGSFDSHKAYISRNLSVNFCRLSQFSRMQTTLEEPVEDKIRTKFLFSCFTQPPVGRQSPASHIWRPFILSLRLDNTEMSTLNMKKNLGGRGKVGDSPKTNCIRWAVKTETYARKKSCPKKKIIS